MVGGFNRFLKGIKYVSCYNITTSTFGVQRSRSILDRKSFLTIVEYVLTLPSLVDKLQWKATGTLVAAWEGQFEG